MVRRVGFGDGDAGPQPLPESKGPADASAQVDSGAAGGEARKRAGPIARAVIALFLLAWIVAWSFAIGFTFIGLAEVWGRGPAGNGDWAALAFLTVWLVGALVGWALGVVFLAVVLFGKPVSPERIAEKRRRREERRRARSDASGAA